VRQVGLGLGDIGVDPRVRKHPQPVHRRSIPTAMVSATPMRFTGDKRPRV